MALGETIIEIIKNLVASGRTKLIALLAADGVMMFGIWKGFVNPGWQTVIVYGMIGFVTLGFFVFRHFEQTNERLKNTAIK